INPDIVSTGYGADLVQGFSRQSKRILESPQYRAVFPHVRLSSEKRTDAKWKVEYFRNGIWVQSSGEVTVTGLGGALTGAVMAIGLRHGRQKPTERDARAYALTQQLRRRFEAEMGHIECRELTGMDLSTLEGIKRFAKTDGPVKVCLPAVGAAYRLVMELLNQPAGGRSRAAQS
ncbi:hypothetical protein LCGC14_2038600, partial [marine sediment metagenome]